MEITEFQGKRVKTHFKELILITFFVCLGIPRKGMLTSRSVQKWYSTKWDHEQGIVGSSKSQTGIAFAQNILKILH